MPTLKISSQQITQFEKLFQSSVEQRCGKRLDSVEEAFWSFNTLPEKQKVNFWEPIAYKLNMVRERVYKFFRFTWSKQFYANLNDYREMIKNDIYEMLDIYNQMYGTSIVTIIWKQIWSKYGSVNLHYDATDQFVRNTINGYYKHQSDRVLPRISQLVIQKFEEPDMLKEPMIEVKESKKQEHQYHQPFSSLESVEQDTMCAQGFVFQQQQDDWVDESFLNFDQGSLYFD
uniref:Uncharacterized protein n=1 Tax=Trepomonas sp. PC1 TaxID=1076344 RepID=A0A146KFB8_9EUKA|eukprot:JAP94121.1 Hypothetical protein TPC1_13341 [Trepomonas sp. PC1]